MASTGQANRQISHLVHNSWSMVCFSCGRNGMASTGQSCAQIVQPMHSSFTSYRMSGVHLPAGQRPCRCASYSSRKYLNVDKIGLGAVFPKPHKLPFFVQRAKFSSSSKSVDLAFPSHKLFMMSSIRLVPVRQKVHFPHDSSCVNDRK